MATLVMHQTRPNLVSPCKTTSPTAKQLLAAARSPCTWTGDTGSNTKRVELGLDFNAAPTAVVNISIVAFFSLGHYFVLYLAEYKWHSVLSINVGI